MRRPLLVEGVLQLLAIDLDQGLAGLDGIAEIREHAADDAFGLRGDRDLVFGGERADDFDGAVERLLPDRLGLHQLRGRLTNVILSDLRSRTTREQRNRQTRQEDHTGGLQHKYPILLGMTRRWNGPTTLARASGLRPGRGRSSCDPQTPNQNQVVGGLSKRKMLRNNDQAGAALLSARAHGTVAAWSPDRG